jgi:two-component system, cell cycle sensor histidine kinase and response regulator CckA
MDPIDSLKADLGSADRTARQEGDAQEAPRKDGSRIRTYTWILITAWTLIMVISLGWNLYQAGQQVQDMALATARINFDKDLLYRRWATRHGGVYVPVTPETPPNPYLQHIPERDLTTPSGRQLTLMNPAYMTRQVYTFNHKESDIRGHLTSLKPLRPENLPDPWEALALKSFEQGKPEASTIEDLEGQAYLRLMRPLKTERGCLKCHAQQGYREGDIRGGISVSLPLAPLHAVQRRTLVNIFLGHGLLWLVGLGGIGLGRRGLITAWHQQERDNAALRQEQAKTQQYLDLVGAAVIAINADQSVAMVNRAGCRLLEYSEEEIVGKNWFDHFLPEREREHGREVFGQLLAGRVDPVKHVENLVVTKSGEERIIAWHNSLMRDEEGFITGTLSSGEDITLRRQAQEAIQESLRLRQQILDTIPSPIFYKGIDGRYQGVNQAFLQFYDKTLEQVLGKTVHEVFPKEIADKYLRMDQDLFKHPGIQVYEFHNYDAHGQRRDISLRKATFANKDGSIAGLAGIMVDITEQKKVEAERLRFSKLESLSTLTGGIAHDFNNIIAAIMGFIEMAQMDNKLGERTRKRLEQAEKGCHRAVDLTKKLLTFAKGGAPVKKPMFIGQLINESVQVALIGSNVKCEIDIPIDLWPVEVDEAQITQAMHNIVINAQQAMPDGGTIQISAGNTILADDPEVPLTSGKYVTVACTDQGSGILPENLTRIFDPYFSTKNKGSGLGLAAAYSIIKGHGGHLAVDSKMGTGSTFIFYLPTSDQEVQPQEEPAEELVPGQGRILVMDDEEMILDLLQQMLSQIGYEVECARDGHEAMALYEDAKRSGRRFAAVIMDLTIPGGMGGKEAIKFLLEFDPHCKAIVSSGYSDDSIMADFQKYGFSGVIAKPYKVSELSKILHNVIINKLCSHCIMP